VIWRFPVREQEAPSIVGVRLEAEVKDAGGVSLEVRDGRFLPNPVFAAVAAAHLPDHDCAACLLADIAVTTLPQPRQILGKVGGAEVAHLVNGRTIAAQRGRRSGVPHEAPQNAKRRSTLLTHG